MIEPPFLELQYYCGTANARRAVELLVDGIVVDAVPAKLSIPTAVGLIAKLEEIEIVGGVVVLRTEGAAFCGTEREDSLRLRKLGRRVYERFLDVADRIRPVYGAILVEYSLEEPSVLRRDPRSLAFRNFFVNREKLGQRSVDEILQVAGEGAYIESRKAGLYISMSAEFNPKRRAVQSPDAQERSVQISAIVGRAASLVR